jgi:hypothetical protein
VLFSLVGTPRTLKREGLDMEISLAASDVSPEERMKIFNRALELRREISRRGRVEDKLGYLQEFRDWQKALGYDE